MGLDPSRVMVHEAEKRLADRIAAGTARLVLGSSVELPFSGGEFSAVTVITAPANLAEVLRMLRPGGRFVFVHELNADPRKPSAERTDGVPGRDWDEAAFRWILEEVRHLPLPTSPRIISAAGRCDARPTLRPPGPRRATGGTDPRCPREGVAMGLRRSFWLPFFGVPRGPLGAVGARLLPMVARPLYVMMATELDLRPDDELLEVGCGSARLLAEQAAQVRFVAGLDLSDLQVGMARTRLAERIAAGTAEIVKGDAMALPWADGRFSVVGSLNCLKFVPDPGRALREMHRVLRPDGRLVLTIDKQADKWGRSGAIDAFGQWQWSPDEARRMVEEAGFADVSVADMPTRLGLQFVRGTKRAAPPVAEVAESPVLVGAAG